MAMTVPTTTRQRSNATNYSLRPPPTTPSSCAAVASTPYRDNDNNNSSNDKRTYKLYWQRWVMLLIMSCLNLLSDWTCYSIAPISVLTDEAFGVIYPTALVVIFLFSNGVATALEPHILSIIGLRRMTVLGSFLGMTGSLCKSGVPFRTILRDGDEWRVYLGFFLVGLSQPLYQCTPALLSASWFPEKERTLATGVALNSNQLGIGCAFVFGSLLVETADDIPVYFSTLSVLFVVTFLMTVMFFEDHPPTPPSETARVIVSKMDGWKGADRDGASASPVLPMGNEVEDTIGILRSGKACFAKAGFAHAVATFTASGIVINTLSTYMDYLIQLDERAGSKTVGVVGGGFQLMVMLSSLFFGHLTDKTRAYFSVIVSLLLFGAFALAECGLVLDKSIHYLPWVLLLVAALVGPLQPVATELAVDVTYPQCENSVLVLLQLFSNFCSSLFIPFFKLCRDVGENRPQYLFSFYLLIVLHAGVTVYFATFEGRYRRLEWELKKKNDVNRITIPSETMPLLGSKIDL